jgi:hypothetical protein
MANGTDGGAAPAAPASSGGGGPGGVRVMMQGVGDSPLPSRCLTPRGGTCSNTTDAAAPAAWAAGGAVAAVSVKRKLGPVISDLSLDSVEVDASGSAKRPRASGDAPPPAAMDGAGVAAAAAGANGHGATAT